MNKIPFRRRLVVRLALSMIGVAAFSLFIVVATSGLFFYVETQRLPIEVRDFIRGSLREELQSEASQMVRRFAFAMRGVQLRSLLIGAAMSAVVWIIFAIRLSRTVASPIEAVTVAASKITQGDLSARVELPSTEIGEAQALLSHFNAMASSLETFERERSEMIAAIAHELRTPLAVMRTRLDVMEEGLVSLNDAEVARLSRQVDLLTRLVNDLRTLSLADSNRLSLNLQVIPLDDVVHEVADSLQARAQEQGVSFKLSLTNVQVKADPDRMAQVIFNLLDNALKHTPKGGKVSINLSQIGDKVNLSVQDTGSGFKGPQEQLFQRFYTTQNHMGTGIGLALVKTIVELHGGSVKAFNVQDAGAVFQVELGL